jgi:hypothetical protein
VLAHTACSMPSVAPKYAIVGRVLLTRLLVPITATVEWSTPPSAGKYSVGTSELSPASTRCTSMLWSAALRSGAISAPSVVTSLDCK